MRVKFASRALVVVAATATVACSAITGVGDWTEVDCVRDCGTRGGDVETDSSDGQTGEEIATLVEASADATDATDAKTEIMLVGSTIAPPISASSLDVSPPPGTAAGDVVVVAMFTDFASSTVTPPSAWSLLTDNPTAANSHAWWFLHIVGATEPPVYHFDVSTTGTTAAVAASYRYVDTTAPVQALASSASPGTTTVATAPTVTPTVANTRLVASFVVDGYSTEMGTWTGPGSMNPLGISSLVAMYDEPWPTTTSTGARTATSTLNSGTAGCQISLRPAP